MNTEVTEIEQNATFNVDWLMSEVAKYEAALNAALKENRELREKLKTVLIFLKEDPDNFVRGGILERLGEI